MSFGISHGVLEMVAGGIIETYKRKLERFKIDLSLFCGFDFQKSKCIAKLEITK